MKKLCVLGSTGSIGTQTLAIAQQFPELLQIKSLVAGKNVDLLIQQALLFQPEKVVIGEESLFEKLRTALADTQIEVAAGEEAISAVATDENVDTVVAAMVGFAGLAPTVAAIQAGKTIALANKETLVVAGALMMSLAQQHQTALLPVDSEHSAIFQCLVGEPKESIEKLILTASGGPFRTFPKSAFSKITKAQALKHPNWTMGAKITIDSATMMNKGLEIIEAKWLFDLPAEKIEVLVHPQSIIHSMVCFADGSVKAQLGAPDMKVPIQYALSYPQRWQASNPRVDWQKLAQLDFEAPDFEKFPCLQLAFDALSAGGTAPCVLNAANEASVALFLADEIRFTDISRHIALSLAHFPVHAVENLSQLQQIDREVRSFVKESVRQMT